MTIVPPQGLRIHGESGKPPRGRSLRATKSFAPGSRIATFSNPLLALPDAAHTRSTCNWCLRPGVEKGSPLPPPQNQAFTSPTAAPTTLSACTGCRCAVYCSKACQMAAWRAGAHKLECPALRRASSRGSGGGGPGAGAGAGGADRSGVVLPTPVRAALLLLLRLAAGDEAVRAAVGDGVLSGGRRAGASDRTGVDVMLEGNVAGFARDEAVWKDLGMQAVAAATYAGMEGLAERAEGIRELLCMIQTNTFDRSDPDTDTGGIFLDPVLAMANHSCVPNAFVCFSGRTAILRAETQIHEGDEIEISYVDNTLSKRERQEALRLYHFQCTCPRCVDDLDVYQVCQSSPLVPLNSFSLQPDLIRLSDPPIDRSLCRPVSVASKRSSGLVASPLERARSQWGDCESLIRAKMFAVEPVPSVLQDLLNFYHLEKQDFARALSLACFLATESHPYAHVAPFKPWRVKGVMLVASLLSQTAPLAVTGELAAACTHRDLVAALSRCDQVSMCEALLRLVVHYGPMAHSDDWEVLRSARELLEDIESLQGRERQSGLLRAWAADPKNEVGRTFFERAVLRPIRELASFALDIASAELGPGHGAVART